MKIYAVVGSRALPPCGGQSITRACDSLIRAGGTLVVGCAAGADAAVLSAGLKGDYVKSVKCFAAFDFDGFGACKVSAVGIVKEFEAAGGAVTWLAGGKLAVPIRARLAMRAKVVVSEATAGCVGFLSSPDSVGTTRALELAVKRGLKVVVFPLEFDPSLLPSLGAGCWLPCKSGGVWSSAWVWSPTSFF